MIVARKNMEKGWKNHWFPWKKREKIRIEIVITQGDTWQSRKLQKYRYIK
jgi:hypothetical protein